MHKFTLGLLSCFLIVGAVSAQQITGKVTDENNTPIAFANVVLYSLPDSVMLTGTITDTLGVFKLAHRSGVPAFIRVSFMGYETKTLPAEKENMVRLKQDSLTLGEVVVSSTRPRIRLQNDALVTTVENSVLSKAGTGNDVLKRLPSLTGDDGVYTVFGKGQARIYINNREMRDVSELDKLNSADIRDVEIINNPGARYDASVKAVIRINTLRRVGDGFSFDARSSIYQSQNTDLREQLNLNYRKRGWDVFGTIHYNRNNSLMESTLSQETRVDTTWVQENTLLSEGLSNTLTGTAGINYEITPKQSAGFRYIITALPSSSSFSSMQSTVLANGKPYDVWSSEEEGIHDDEPSHRFNAYYNGDFGKLKIDFNADLFSNQLLQRTRVDETSREFDNRTVNAQNDVSNRLIASKLVLSHPVLGGQFSLGGEFTNTHREDVYVNRENIVPSSNTGFEESNKSLFAEFSRGTPIGQFGAGLRYENVNSDYFSNNVKVDGQSRDYANWFPNASLATQIKNVTLQLSYTAKTKRPTYRQLSSNVFYGNRFTLQTGNPFLKPSTTRDVTLVGVWKFVQVMAAYTNETDAIIYWTEQLKENPAISLIAYRNFDRLPSLTTFVTLSPTFGIWSPQLSAGMIKQWLTITSNNQPLTLNKPLPIATFNNSFRLPEGYVVSLDANFQGDGNYQNIYLAKNILMVNAGLTKSFFKDNLRVELKGHDLFRGKKDGTRLYNRQMELYQQNIYDSRQIELTLRYLYNPARSKYKGTGAGDREINRL